MASRKHCRIRTTAYQRDRFQAVVEYFGQQGYFFVPVAKFYRRHHLDVVAVPKHSYEHMMLILPGRNETVEIRPYDKSLYRKLQSHRKHLPGVWWKRQLPRKKIKDWRDYISPHHMEKLRLLIKD